MTRRFEVRFTEAAREDLFQHSLEAAGRALGNIERALTLLGEFSWSCRASTAVPRTRFRELIIPFGKRGYVALFEIEGDDVVTILAVRHQRESDYH